MATLGSTNISGLIAPGGEQPQGAGDSGMILEFFRVASGGASGDTVTLTPRFASDIRTVMSSVSADNNLSTNAGNTNVTLTLRIGTNTAAAFDVWMWGRR